MPGSRARARIDVLNPDGTLAHRGEWGPWETMNTNWGRILQGVFSGATLGVDVQKNFTDRGGTARNNQSVRRANITGSFLAGIGADGTRTYTRVGWGDGAAAPTRDDTDISGVQAVFNISSASSDEVAATVTVTGAAVYGGAGTNLTRLGLYIYGCGGVTATDTNYLFLIDHSTYSSTAVATGQTVSVTYEVAY